MKFDWIDFGLSWKEEWGTSKLDKLFHNSTASLLAQVLRRREAPFNKVFCWLRRTGDVLELGDTPGIRYVEMTFPFADYEAEGADRLAVFADWLVRAIAAGAPELGIENDEIHSLTSALSEEGYVYSRVDKLKRIAGEPRCEIVYKHGPNDLVVTAICKLRDGRAISRTLKGLPLLRDELVYGRAIRGCTVGRGDELEVELAYRPGGPKPVPR